MLEDDGESFAGVTSLNDQLDMFFPSLRCAIRNETKNFSFLVARSETGCEPNQELHCILHGAYMHIGCLPGEIGPRGEWAILPISFWVLPLFAYHRSLILISTAPDRQHQGYGVCQQAWLHGCRWCNGLMIPGGFVYAFPLNLLQPARGTCRDP